MILWIYKHNFATIIRNFKQTNEVCFYSAGVMNAFGLFTILVMLVYQLPNHHHHFIPKIFHRLHSIYSLFLQL